MCGICGIVQLSHSSTGSLRHTHADILEEMTARLAHRGPDGHGYWFAPQIALGHTRLAILDPHSRSAQPMLDPSQNSVISYNGELYNFQDLRKSLEQAAYVFRTSSDTEVILYALRHWGPQAIEKFIGIFAFAFWQQDTRRLILARDALGVKPLFYAQHRGLLYFASEIKALLANPELSVEHDARALDAFFTFGYTPAPLTGLAAVRQLMPGAYLEIVDGVLKAPSYWTSPAPGVERGGSFRQRAAEFESLIDEVTASQMVSDVGCGAFLSGGLDSALIARSMVRASTSPPKALCMGFSDSSFDERLLAQQTAQALGLELQCELLEQNPVDLLEETSYFLEEPTADSSALAVYELCRAARELFPVALSGDGADELLAGYPTYQASKAASLYRLLPRGMRRRVLAALCRAIPVEDEKYSWHKVLHRFAYGAELGPLRDHASWRIMFTDAQKEKLYTAEFSNSCSAFDPLSSYIEAMGQRGSSAATPGLRAWLQGDLSFYLANDMLVKIDRMSMAHGLEVRVPYLDPRIVRFCTALPDEYRLPWGLQRKQLIRHSLKQSIPSSVLGAPKSGFNVPLERWMRGELHDLLFDLVAKHRTEVGEYFDLKALQTLAGEHKRKECDHAHRLFTVLMFVTWIDNLALAFRRPQLAALGRKEKKALHK